jgi:hypothetical protein
LFAEIGVKNADAAIELLARVVARKARDDKILR